MRNALLIAAGTLAVLTLWIWRPSAQVGQPSAEPPPTAAGRPARPIVPPASAPDAAILTARAREKLDRDPSAALRDIEHADRIAGGQDEQRRALEIVALVRVGRVGHARALTDRFYRAFPASREIQQLERLTGYHPRPYAP